jgi:hypothetical protein
MIWYFYGTILACSYVNWGGIITSQNMKRKDFVVKYHLEQINFSERGLLQYAKDKNDPQLKKKVIEKMKDKSSRPFLSKILYCETLKE